MPEFNLPDIRDVSPDDVAEILGKTLKTVNWLLNNLDHLNVKRLYTEYCKIRSAAGETVIDGPRLLMYDKQATPQLRLKAGYDDVTGDFLFELYNKAGVKTVGIDSNGDATFTGIITGGIIQTAETGNRIVLTNNTLLTYKYNSLTLTDQLNGIAWGQDVETGGTYGDVYFYDSDIPVMRFRNNLFGAGYTIESIGSAHLSLGGGSQATDAYGIWNFTNANITGLVTNIEGAHDHGGTVPSDGGHSHTVTT